MTTRIEKCRICGNPELTPIIHLGNHSLTGVFPPAPDFPVTVGPLELVKCHGNSDAHCGLVQLAHSYPLDEMYGSNYGYRSSLNRSMVDHLHRKVDRLLQLSGPDGPKTVVDIGSNDGTTLSFYSPEFTRIGIDPTAAKFRQYYQPGIQVIEDFFGAAQFVREFGAKKADIVTSIAMFYDLEDPIHFARDVASILAPDGIWHFEQSYLPAMIEVNAYDTICQEHLSYYAVKQIKWILDASGLKIIDIATNDVNGGSFCVTAALQTSRHPEASETVHGFLAAEAEMGLDGLEVYRKFSDDVFRHREELRETLSRCKAEGALVLGYGASTKGNVILQFCGFGPDDIAAIAEVNADKFGCFTPGTNIPIISEEQARAMSPAYFVVLPWHFRPGIIKREAAYLQQGGKLIFPLPTIEIVSA